MKTLSITHVANLFGDGARIQMLAALLDGNSHSASELALAAQVSPQTASSHLSKLTIGRLIITEPKGRQRFFRLRNPEVAAAVESVCALADTSLGAPVPALRFARTCYDHMGGVLAITLRDQLLRKGVLKQEANAFILTHAGERFLHSLHIDVQSLRSQRRSFSRKCLDWTERHHHIGGAVGAALLSRWVGLKWVARMKDTRAIRVTLEGELGFERLLGIRCAEIRSRAAS
jgi:DNA-binding transcriptional ArsR family regulator